MRRNRGAIHKGFFLLLASIATHTARLPKSGASHSQTTPGLPLLQDLLQLASHGWHRQAAAYLPQSRWAALRTTINRGLCGTAQIRRRPTKRCLRRPFARAGVQESGEATQGFHILRGREAHKGQQFPHPLPGSGVRISSRLKRRIWVLRPNQRAVPTQWEIGSSESHGSLSKGHPQNDWFPLLFL